MKNHRFTKHSHFLTLKFLNRVLFLPNKHPLDTGLHSLKKNRTLSVAPIIMFRTDNCFAVFKNGNLKFRKCLVAATGWISGTKSLAKGQGAVGRKATTRWWECFRGTRIKRTKTGHVEVCMLPTSKYGGGCHCCICLGCGTLVLFLLVPLLLSKGKLKQRWQNEMPAPLYWGDRNRVTYTPVKKKKLLHFNFFSPYIMYQHRLVRF